MGEKETATAADLAGEETERVKGSKSNTSERSTVQDFEKNTEARATSVKSGKSNSSDRWQDDNFDDDETPSTAARTVKSSKSNTSD